MRLSTAHQTGCHPRVRPRAPACMARTAGETQGGRDLRLLDLPPRAAIGAVPDGRRLRPCLGRTRSRPGEPSVAGVHGTTVRARTWYRAGRAVRHDEGSIPPRLSGESLAPLCYWWFMRPLGVLCLVSLAL